MNAQPEHEPDNKQQETKEGGTGTTHTHLAQLHVPAINAAVAGWEAVVASERVLAVNKEGSDFAYKADLAAETVIRNMLAETGLPVVGEEEGGVAGTNLWWLVDPLDGTHNYAAGFTEWSVSVALMVGNTPKGGVIVGSNGEVVSGGFGTVTPGIDHGVDIRNSKRIGIEGPGIVLGKPDGTVHALKTIAGQYGVRSVGSCVTAIADVARGKLEACVLIDAHEWDYAAGAAIIKAAGGVAVAGNGKTWTAGEPVCIAGPAKTVEALRVLINS